MEDFINRQKNTDVTAEGQVEIPGFFKKGFMYNKTWTMRFRVFDLTDRDDIRAIEELYTRATKHGKNRTEGVTIIEEVGRFFDDGSYKMMVYWGEWKDEKRSNELPA